MLLDRVAEIGFDDVEAPITSEFGGLVALRNGGFLSIDPAEAGTLRFHGPGGAFQRAVTGEGDGPGEFRGVHHVAWTEDGYMVYDVRQSRLTWVDHDFRFQRSSAVNFLAWRMLLLPDDRFVVNGLTPEYAPEGHTILIRQLDGSIDSAFGGDGRPIDMRRDQSSLSRLIALDHAGNVWTSKTNDYQLVRFSPSGDTLATIQTQREWFRPWIQPNVPTDLRSGPPTPSVEAILLDEFGLLWIVLHVGADDWESAVREADGPLGFPDRRKLWDTVIEVIDPTSGELVASTRYPEAILAVGASRYTGQVLIYYVDERSDYTLGMSVLRASLTQADGSQGDPK